MGVRGGGKGEIRGTRIRKRKNITKNSMKDRDIYRKGRELIKLASADVGGITGNYWGRCKGSQVGRPEKIRKYEERMGKKKK